MNNFTKLGVTAALASCLPAFAVDYAVVGLGFEKMQVQSFDDNVPPKPIYLEAQVWEFYSGGYSRSEDGSTNLVLGPDNYSVPFTSSALAIRAGNQDGTGNFGPRYLDIQGGPLLPDAGMSALIFTSGNPVFDYASGFGTGFSFYYASTGQITVALYDGLNASGALLGSGTFQPTPTCTLADNTFCVWSVGKVSFSGIARSARLGGLVEQALFDNVTFGSLTPIDGAIPIPEPASMALMAIGLGGIAWAARRRRPAV